MLCACGCGEFPGLAKKTSKRDGTIKGQPKKYVPGHKPRAVVLRAKQCLDCGASFETVNGKRCADCNKFRFRERDRGYQKVKRSKPSHKGRYRAYSILRNYGVTIEEYERCLASQGGRCAICRTGESGKKNWHVDHEHGTGRVRGLLCSNCNLMLGYAKESGATLLAAIIYLASPTFER